LTDLSVDDGRLDLPLAANTDERKLQYWPATHSERSRRQEDLRRMGGTARQLVSGAMSNQSIAITRRGLYEKVWNEPIVRVARILGLSGRGLGKLCARHDIPVPPRGWWARKRHGKLVRQTPLEHPETAERIVIQASAQREPVSVESSELEREKEPTWRIAVSPDLPITNQLAKMTGAEMRRRWNRRPDAASGQLPLKRVAPTQILHTAVSPSLLPRALRIWQALLDAFDRRGYAVSFDAQGNTIACVLGERFEIALLERRKQVFIQRTWGRGMELEPSGLLFLRVGGSYSNSGTADKPPHKIEDRLNRFVSGLIRRALEAKRARAVREEREARWRVEDDQRRSREQERLSEIARIRRLRSLALQWARDRRLAEFLADIDQRAQKEWDEERRARATEWLTWANQLFQRRDPVAAFVDGDWPEAALPPPSAMPWNWV
jgi:hypothetical protein